MRMPLRLLAAALIIPLLGVTPPTLTQMSSYLQPQRRIDIGGRHLNLYCTGTGSPTVILDAGLGGSTEDWYKVQPAIAKQTRVCSYDRAGMGFSDGTKTRRDPDAVVDDLHALLQRAGVLPPYVLVGHSIAGLYEVLFANRYATEVAGMVAVDPSRPFMLDRFRAVAPAIVQSSNEQAHQMQQCYVALAHGEHGAGDLKACGFETPQQLARDCAKDGRGQCAVDELQDRQMHDPLFWYDALEELRSFLDGKGSNEVQASQRSYGALPLIVLTADYGPHHDRGLSIPKSQAAAFWNVWKTMHDELAAQSSIGVNFVVEDSGHFIQLDQPAAVISAISEIIDQSRVATASR